jgi:pimeloyl-ACP methyl ester carboxylesterase
MPETEGLHFNTLGKGKNVVFLHGFLENATMWKTLPLEQLNRKCWFIDLPGHGNSPFDFPINEELTLTQVGQKIMNFLSLSGVQPYDIVGHSLGGYIALAIKAMDKNCRKTLLMNSNFWQDDEPRQQNRDRFAHLILKNKKRMFEEIFPSLFFNPDAHVEHIEKLKTEANEMVSTDIAAYALAMKNRLHFGKLLATFPNEIALIHGEKDPLISIKNLQEETTCLGNTIFNIREAGHMSHFESPDELARIFKVFLQP